jgi:hypothetical protein
MGISFPMHVREVMEEDREKGTAYLAADGVGKAESRQSGVDSQWSG